MCNYYIVIFIIIKIKIKKKKGLSGVAGVLIKTILVINLLS